MIFRRVGGARREVGAAGDDRIDAADSEKPNEGKSRDHGGAVLLRGAAPKAPEAGARAPKRHVQARPNLARHLRKRNTAATPNFLSLP
jgi:hypothetical protein